MLQTSSQGRQPFVYPSGCPALAFSGSVTGNWPTCLVGYIIVQIIPSFSGSQPLCSYSVPCPSYPLIIVLFSFPSLTSDLTGTKPGCVIWGFTSRLTSCSSSFFLIKLVYECFTFSYLPIAVFTYVLCSVGLRQAFQKQTYLPLHFVCCCCVMESKCRLILDELDSVLDVR